MRRFVDVDVVPATSPNTADTPDQESVLIRRRRSIVDWNRRADKVHNLPEVSYDLIVSDLPTSFRVMSKKRKAARLVNPEVLEGPQLEQLGEVAILQTIVRWQLVELLESGAD